MSSRPLQQSLHVLLHHIFTPSLDVNQLCFIYFFFKRKSCFGVSRVCIFNGLSSSATWTASVWTGITFQSDNVTLQSSVKWSHAGKYLHVLYAAETFLRHGGRSFFTQKPEEPKALAHTTCVWLIKAVTSNETHQWVKATKHKNCFSFFYLETPFKLLPERLRSRLSFSKGTLGGRDKKTAESSVCPDWSFTSFIFLRTDSVCSWLLFFLLIAARLQKIFWELFHGFESSLSLTLSSLWLSLFFIFFAINIVS